MSNEYLKTELIRNIQKSGPIPFSQFMEIVLYHPEWGYYSTRNETQDYITNVDVHPIYGKLLAYFILQECERFFLKNNERISILELGCGNGKLASQILSQIEATPWKNKIQYYCIDASPERRAACEKLKTRFNLPIQVLSHFNFKKNTLKGIVFSNEFFDALPFDRIISKNKTWYEFFVNENIQEILQPARKETIEYLNELKIYPSENAIAEVHRTSKEWIQKITNALQFGTILTIDYGYETQELYSEFKMEGTALCHLKNKTNKNFYTHLGEQDITAHINFTTLMQTAQKHGFESEKLKTQTQFLLNQNLEEWIQSIPKIKDSKEQLQLSSAIKTLIHPEGMGGTFKVLIQRKTEKLSR